jgi:hypothetical protein
MSNRFLCIGGNAEKFHSTISSNGYMPSGIVLARVLTTRVYLGNFRIHSGVLTVRDNSS